MEDTGQQQMLILKLDEHGNQSFVYDDGSGTERLHLRSESSDHNSVDELNSFVLNKSIKMEQDDEITAVLIQRDECDDDPLSSALSVPNGLVLQSPMAVNDSHMEDMNFSSDPGDDDAGIIMQHMDIREPLSTLRQLLEIKLNISLSGYEFWLQDAQMLQSHKNLVDQCVQGEGMVQVNVQIKVDDAGNKKINIVDVLKPAEEFVEINPMCSDETSNLTTRSQCNDDDNDGNDPKNAVKWIIDNNFRRNQARLNIPKDPNDWDVAHVRHWLLWAVRQFNLTGIKLSDWKINGEQLCNLSLAEYRKKVPHDLTDLFWTHLQLLKKCKFVAVVHNSVTTPLQEVPEGLDMEEPLIMEDKKEVSQNVPGKIRGKLIKSKPKVVILDSAITASGGNRTGNNGQIQLWQFLLELLTDKLQRDCIQWIGTEGEFKLVNPETVARLWGIRKNKPTMNYEKLSRALRYYYDGDMISKVHGKRFVYKFVCNLKQLLGYSASELNKHVIDAEQRCLDNNARVLQASQAGWDFITNGL